MEKAILQGVLIKLVALVPYRLKLWLKHSSILAPSARKSLDILLGLGQDRSTVKIASGLLAGYVMSLHLRVEKSYWQGVWEPKLQQLVKELVKEGMVVYDVGAHIGFFSLLFSKYCGQEGKVFSFEPDAGIFSRLNQNITLNRVKNITAIPVAVSDKKGSAFFDKTKIDSMGHLTQKEESPGSLATVATDTLDSFVYEQKNPAPNIVKIDVEGAEDKVLLGMERVLKEARPLVLCEVHNYEVAQEVSQILSRNHYQLFNIDRDFSAIPDFKGYYGICHVLAKPEKIL